MPINFPAFAYREMLAHTSRILELRNLLHFMQFFQCWASHIYVCMSCRATLCTCTMYTVRMKWINLFGVIWCENTKVGPLVFWTCLSSLSYFRIANFSVIYQILVMSVSVLLLSTLFVLGYQIRALNLFKLKHEEVLIFTWRRYKFIPSEHIACKYPFMAD